MLQRRSQKNNKTPYFKSSWSFTVIDVDMTKQEI